MPVKKTTPKKKSVRKKATKKAPVTPKERNVNPTIALIVAIVLLGTVLFVLIYVPKHAEQRELERNSYNNYEFKEWEGGLWTVNVEVNGIPMSILMHYHPQEVDTIPVEQEAVDIINAAATKVAVTGKGRLFLTMNPDAPGGVVIAGVELAKVLGEKFNIYNIPTKASFSRPKENYSGVPVVTCEDAVNDTYVIYIREHDNDFVGVPEGFPQCIVVQGTDINQTIKAADRFVYALFNIIPAS